MHVGVICYVWLNPYPYFATERNYNFAIWTFLGLLENLTFNLFQILLYDCATEVYGAHDGCT